MARPIKYIGDNKDGWMERLLKAIPSEIVAAMAAGYGMVTAGEGGDWLLWVILGCCVVATPIWMIFQQKVTGKVQIILATLAVGVWDMSLPNGAFQSIDGFLPVIGSVFLLLYTLLISPGATLITRAMTEGD